MIPILKVCLSTGSRAVVAMIIALLYILWPAQLAAHFSYSDPRIVHIAQEAENTIVVLVRMPLPLALLPADWQGSSETRLPPFSHSSNGEVLLSRAALKEQPETFHKALHDGLSVWLDDEVPDIVIGSTRIWHDDNRPSFGTIKSAQKSFEKEQRTQNLPYFDATIDVEYKLVANSLKAAIRLQSQLGENFQVIEKFGTVVKLHRDSGTDTRAMIGILDMEYPPVLSRSAQLRHHAFVGAEHIYLGLDHLAMIVLIAIAAIRWQQALLWASAFTVGHVITLAAGLYGYAPQASWFITVIELFILLSIVAAGVSIVLKLPQVMSWPALFIIGLIHGYGFASAASVALFSEAIDVAALIAFAVGLELCQLAVYAAILPVMTLLDRVARNSSFTWRRPLSFCLAAAAGLTIVQQFVTAESFGIV